MVHSPTAHHERAATSRRHVLEAANRVAGGYLLLAALWILVSDRLLSYLGGDAETIANLQTLKGWLFVTLSAALLHVLLLRHGHRQALTVAAAEAAETRYRRLLEAVPEAVLVLDHEGRLTYLSEHSAHTFGYSSPAALMAATTYGLDLLAPEERSRAQADLERCLAHDEVLDLAYVALRADGRRFPIEVRAARLCTAEARCEAVVLARDLSLQERAEAERNRLATVIDQATDGILLLDPSGHVRYANASFSAITGLGPGELLGRAWPTHSPLLAEQSGGQALLHAIAEAQPVNTRFMARRGEDFTYTAEATVFPVRGEDGRLLQLAVMLRDVTRELELEETLRQTGKLEALGQLAGGVAHDFNNILSAIIGYSEMLRLGLDDDDERRADVDQVLRAADRAAGLVRQLLAFSRNQPVSPRLLDLNSTLRDATKMLRRLIGEHVELHLNLAEAPLTICADPLQVEQVLINLAVNARDAMPDGGRIDIGSRQVVVTADEAQPATPLDVLPGAYHVLSVRDNGSGMDAATRRRIFEPFFTTKSASRGTGLGLATVYGIVTQAGGAITCDSQVGRGTTFHVYWPRADGDREAEHAVSGDHALGGNETVLLVEDEPGVRVLARRILEHYGYTVLEADGASAALTHELLHSEPIDLVLADVVMPGMTGPALIQEVRQRRPSMRSLLMTGHTDSADWLGDADGLPVLHKPFTPHGLAQRVREVLDAPSPDGLRAGR